MRVGVENNFSCSKFIEMGEICGGLLRLTCVFKLRKESLESFSCSPACRTCAEEQLPQQS